MKKNILLVIALLLALSSCKLAPKYVRPDYSLDSTAIRFAVNSDTATIADLRWRELFQDSVLLTLIDEGLKNNLNLLMTYQKVYQSKKNYDIAKVQIWPMLNLEGSITKSRTESSLGGMATNEMDLYGGPSLSWELDFFGKLRSLSDVSKAQYLSSAASLQALRISLISQIATNYYSLLQARRVLSITKNNLTTLQESLDLVSLQLEVGTTTAMTVAQARAELASTRMQIPTMEMNVGLLENNIMQLIGRLPAAIDTAGVLEGQLNLYQLPSTGVPSELLNRRPDVIAAEQSLIAANANIGAAKAALFPSVSVSGLFAYYKIGKGWGYDLLGSLVQPIFGEGRLINAYKQSKSAKVEMLYNYQSVVYAAITEVSNAILTYEKSLEQMSGTRAFLEEAKVEFDLSNQLYQNGLADYLDVLTSQRSYFSAQISMCEVQTSVLKNYVSLYKALGGGW